MAQQFLPISCAHHRDGISADFGFFRQKAAPDGRLDAQHLEELARDERHRSADRLAAAEHSDYLGAIFCSSLQRVIARSHVLKIPVGERDLSALRIYLSEADNAFRLRIRQLP